MAGGAEGCGVLVSDGGRGLIEGNDISGRLSGVTIASRGNPHVARNRIHDCTASGVVAQDGALGQLDDNTVSGNAPCGVRICGGASLHCAENKVSGNQKQALGKLDSLWRDGIY